MAIIHHGKNKLREELNSYYEKECQRAREISDRIQQDRRTAYANECKAFRRAIPIRLLLIILSLSLLLYFVFSPELILQLQEAVHSLFTWLEDCLANVIREDMATPSSGISEALLNLLLSVLSLIAALLLGLFKLLSWPLALLVCVGIPGVVIFFSAKRLIRRPKLVAAPTFDERARREEIMSRQLPSEQQILKAGLEGEESALKLLSTLGNDCHIYTNLLIPFDGKVSETDLIVVAPHTVTIVEVKNYQDELSGDWSDEHLVLEAERGSSIHRHEVYNPVRQVATHVYRLNGYLREHGAACTVNSCVLFVNSNVHTYLMQDAKGALTRCPVFISYQLESLLDYLLEPCKGTSGKSVVARLNELAASQVDA